MNSSLSLRVQGGMEYKTNHQSPTQKAAILKNLRVVIGDTNLASNLSQVWVRDFQLVNPEQANSSHKVAEAHSVIATLPLDNNNQVIPSNPRLLILDTASEDQFQENLACARSIPLSSSRTDSPVLTMLTVTFLKTEVLLWKKTLMQN